MHLLLLLMQMSCQHLLIIVVYLEPEWPMFWLELGPFGEWNRFKRVCIQRFLTLPTPNLSHSTASLGLGRLLCGSQMPRFPICPIWLKTWLVMWMCHAWKTKAKVPTSTHTFVKEQIAKPFRAFAWFGGIKNNSWYQSHMTDSIDPAKLEQSENTEKRNTQELPKSPEHFGDLIADLSWTWQQTSNKILMV